MYFDILMKYKFSQVLEVLPIFGRAALKLLKVCWFTVCCFQCVWRLHLQCNIVTFSVSCSVLQYYSTALQYCSIAVLQGEAWKQGNALSASFRQLSCKPILSRFSVFSTFCASFQFAATFLKVFSFWQLSCKPDIFSGSALFSVFTTISCSILHPN